MPLDPEEVALLLLELSAFISKLAELNVWSTSGKFSSSNSLKEFFLCLVCPCEPKDDDGWEKFELKLFLNSFAKFIAEASKRERIGKRS